MKDPVRILCVDDDVTIRSGLSALCEAQGWEYDSASLVEEGLALYKQKPFDLLIMDYHLPGMNGVDGTRAFRRLSPAMPILAFTVDDNRDLAEAFFRAGATDYALKPLREMDMASRLRLNLLLKEKGKTVPKKTRKRRPSVSGQETKEKLLRYLGKQSVPLAVEEIAEGTDLAVQTVYRYLQQLEEEKRVLTRRVYGSVGRPRIKFYVENATKARHFLERYREAKTDEPRIYSLYNALGSLSGFDQIPAWGAANGCAAETDQLVSSVQALREAEDETKPRKSVTVTEDAIAAIAEKLESCL